MCVPKAVAEDRWPFSTAIPPLLQYPVGLKAFEFVSSLVWMFYAPSWAGTGRPSLFVAPVCSCSPLGRPQEGGDGSTHPACELSATGANRQAQRQRQQRRRQHRQRRQQPAPVGWLACSHVAAPCRFPCDHAFLPRPRAPLHRQRQGPALPDWLLPALWRQAEGAACRQRQEDRVRVAGATRLRQRCAAAALDALKQGTLAAAATCLQVTASLHCQPLQVHCSPFPCLVLPPSRCFTSLLLQLLFSSDSFSNDSFSNDSPARPRTSQGTRIRQTGLWQGWGRQ